MNSCFFKLSHIYCFPASRGLCLLPLIFASSWETSAGREVYCQMYANFPGVDFLGTALKFRKGKKNSSSHVYVLHQTCNEAFSRCSRARAKLLFCFINLFLYLMTFSLPSLSVVAESSLVTLSLRGAHPFLRRSGHFSSSSKVAFNIYCKFIFYIFSKPVLSDLYLIFFTFSKTKRNLFFKLWKLKKAWSFFQT